MAIFQRMSKSDIEQYTHYALFLGFVPVYFREEGGEGCAMAVRNWWPEWIMDAGEFLFSLFCWCASLIDPSFEAEYPITLTGEIHADEYPA